MMPPRHADAALTPPPCCRQRHAVSPVDYFERHAMLLPRCLRRCLMILPMSLLRRFFATGCSCRYDFDADLPPPCWLLDFCDFRQLLLQLSRGDATLRAAEDATARCAEREMR